MDDLKPIIYIIFLVIYVLSRIFRKPKKSDMPAPGTVQPPVEKKSENLFDVIREEIKKQQELAKAQQEPPQKVPVPKRQFTIPLAKKAVQAKPSYTKVQPIIEPAEQEGVTAFDKKTKRVFLIEEKEAPAFEFNPREAFRMKILLEKPLGLSAPAN